MEVQVHDGVADAEEVYATLARGEADPKVGAIIRP
jgi:hypothetical protein